MKYKPLLELFKEKNIDIPYQNQKINVRNPFSMIEAIDKSFFEVDAILNSKTHTKNSLENTQTQIENLNSVILNKLRKARQSSPKNNLLQYIPIINQLVQNYFTKKTKLKGGAELLFLNKLKEYLSLLEGQKTTFGDGLILGIYRALYQNFYIELKANYSQLVEDPNLNIANEESFNQIKDVLIENEELLVKKKDLARAIILSLNVDFIDLAYNVHVSAKLKQQFIATDYQFLPEFEDQIFAFIFYLLEESKIISVKRDLTISRNYFYKIDPELLYETIQFPSSIPPLPMISSPREWHLASRKMPNKESSFLSQVYNNSSLQELSRGGYIKNDIEIFGGVSKLSPKSSAVLGPEHLKTINHLQQTSYKVNSLLLQDFSDNFVIYYKKYLDSMEDLDYKNFVEFDLNLTLATIIPFDRYIEIKVPKTIEDYKVKLNLIKKYRLLYRSLALATCEFAQLFSIATLFKDFILWFPWYYDLRARAYANGYLLFPHGNKLSKSLLDLYVSSSFENETLDKQLKRLDIKARQNLEYYLYEIKNSNKASSFFMQRRISQNISISVIPLDATASGSSIMFGLAGCLSGMIDTNVLISQHEQSYKRDPYKVVMNEIHKQYENEKQKLIEKNYEHLDYLMQTQSFFNRARTKDFVLCFNYSEGRRARILKILDWFKKEIGKSDIDMLEKNLNLILFGVCSRAEHIFLRSIKKSYPNLILMRNLILNVFENNRLRTKLREKNKAKVKEQLAIFEESFVHMKQTFSKFEKKELAYIYKQRLEEVEEFLWSEILDNIPPYLVVGSNKSRWLALYRLSTIVPKKIHIIGGKMKTFTLNKDTKVLDTTKLLCSCVPHFVHNLDASILLKVVLSCSLSNINLYTAHDSFYVKPEDADILKNFYFEAYSEILLKNNPVEVYFEINNLDVPSLYKDICKDFINNKQQILSKIENKEFVKNEYILC